MENGAESTGEVTLEVTRERIRGPWVLEIGTPEGSRQARLEPGRPLVLGAGRLADVRVLDPTVSARHCRVTATARGVAVEDVGSKNGVFVGAARVSHALLAKRLGAFVIGRTTVVLRGPEADDESGTREGIPGLVGTSSAMLRVAEEVRRHAPLRAPVLVRGESGTGKDLVAQALHRLSGRSGAFVPLNVGAVPESLADGELFGHRRGAFTGAVATRLGAFEQAQRGTLFLDEVAELPASMQVKLLRVVEDGVVRPVGASQPLTVDVRVVSATWAPLEEWVQLRRFRADLLHRLSTVVIEIPPLRQRKSDIPMLCHALIRRFVPEVGPKCLTSGAIARLVEHTWPGNVRELGAVLYRAAVATDSEVIEACHVQLPEIPIGIRPQALAPAEALVLLERHAGNITAASRAAQVPRSTFRSWLGKARER
ncbi:MAG: sigma 54-dependent Fis family transcriptional regulator [Myxococcales bacterium]|nr:sigma 54-dependent Fis family transcriptional regulator [Myxococcales bacterium]